MTRKTTPERPPTKAELSLAGKAVSKPSAVTKSQIRTLGGRVLSEGAKRKPR